MRIVISIVAVLLLTNCNETPESSEGPSQVRPVTVLELTERDFKLEKRLTGSVSLYREEKIAFEVAGRLLAVQDVGLEFVGPTFDNKNILIRQGGVIAKLDDTRHRLRVQGLEARLRSLKKSLEAQRIDVDRVAEATLSAARARLRVAQSEVLASEKRIPEAQAELTRARKELARQKRLIQGSAGRIKGLDNAQADFDSGVARLARRRDLLVARRQLLGAQRAAVEVAEATIALKAAQVGATVGKIEALLSTGSTKRLIAKRYRTSEGNLHHWLKQRGIGSDRGLR